MGAAPTRPGIPDRHSIPAHCRSTAWATSLSHGSPAPAVRRTHSPVRCQSMPVNSSLTTSPEKPSSPKTTFEPSPSAKSGSPRACAHRTACRTPSRVRTRVKKRAQPPTPRVDRGASGTCSSIRTSSTIERLERADATPHRQPEHERTDGQGGQVRNPAANAPARRHCDTAVLVPEVLRGGPRQQRDL